MRFLALLVLGLLAVVLAGCGGGGGGSHLSHGDLVRQGDALCVAASGKIDRLGDPASLADVARVGAKLAMIRNDETDALAALAAARADEAGQRALIAALRARDATLRDLVTAARRGDQAGATKALAAGRPLGSKASDAALDLGLLRCAEGG